jgi:RNA polymerase sigma factor (sigma-70 family)
LPEDVPGLVDHFFRREAGKMVAYLTRIVGLGRLDLAEDVVQDTLLRALESWSIGGLPDNPSAWLMRVARNRAIDLLRRDRQFRDFTPQLTHLLRLQEALPGEEAAFEGELRDDQLRMMVSLCHPELSSEGQVTLILKTLCGFSVSEIAHALLVREESVEKRLGRARKLFRVSGRLVALTNPAEIAARLGEVHQAIYLLFNEGYHGSGAETTVRQELCFEAIHLALILSEHPEGDCPKTQALLALLCFHAARLPGRLDDEGALIQLQMQDRTLWDHDLIGRGFVALDRSATGSELSEYHLEAAIASVHCAAATYEATDWPQILGLYDALLRQRPSPIVALNRAIALGMAEGPEAGLAALNTLGNVERLRDYPFYPAAQGEFHLLAGRTIDAARHFQQALALGRNRTEAAFFARKLESCRDA